MKSHSTRTSSHIQPYLKVEAERVRLQDGRRRANKRLDDSLRAICETLCQLPHGRNLQEARLRLAEVSQQLKVAAEQGLVDRQTKLACGEYISTIRILAKATIEAGEISKVARSRCIADAETSSHLDAVRNATGSEFTEEVKPATSSPASSDLSYDSWRRWFLEHLSFPYPDAVERNHLLAQMPSLDITKLQTWFTNTRRRSGWSSAYKRYAGGKKEDMQELVRAVDDPFAASFIDQAAVMAITSIREYFAEGDKRKQVADWMEEVIDKHKNGLLASPETTSKSSPSSITSSPALSNLSSLTPARRRRPAKKAKASLYETSGRLASPETTSSYSPSSVTSSPSLLNLSSPTPARRRRPAKKAKATLYETPETPNLHLSISDDIPVIEPMELNLSVVSCMYSLE